MTDDQFVTVELPPQVGALLDAAVRLVSALREVQEAALLVSMQARDAGVDVAALPALPALRAALERVPIAEHERFIEASRDVRLPECPPRPERAGKGANDVQAHGDSVR